MGDIINFKDYYEPIPVGSKRYKNNVVDFNTYKNKKNNKSLEEDIDTELIKEIDELLKKLESFEDD